MSDIFEKAIPLLEKDILPENWEWVGCSKLARMAKYKGDQESYFKEFIPKNRLEVIKSKVRGSKCELWIKQAHIAKKAGFAVPGILENGELSNGNHYLITASGPSKAASDFLIKSPAVDESKRQQWIKEFGTYIGEMHKAGIIHGDLRAGNILMEPSSPALFMMIDIERNSFHKAVPLSLARKNLVQLIKRIRFNEFTAKDRMSFLKHYHQAFGVSVVINRKSLHWT